MGTREPTRGACFIIQSFPAKEGFKINDGDCPFYALIKAKGDAKDPTSSTPEQRNETPTASIPKPKRVPAPAPVISLGFSASGDSIIATIGACSTTLAKQDAIKACRDLLSLVCG